MRLDIAQEWVLRWEGLRKYQRSPQYLKEKFENGVIRYSAAGMLCEIHREQQGSVGWRHPYAYYLGQNLVDVNYLHYRGRESMYLPLDVMLWARMSLKMRNQMTLLDTYKEVLELKIYTGKVPKINISSDAIGNHTYDLEWGPR